MNEKSCKQRENSVAVRGCIWWRFKLVSLALFAMLFSMNVLDCTRTDISLALPEVADLR